MFLRPFFVDDGKAGGVWELHITISIIVKGKLPIAINNECGNTPIDGTELYVASYSVEEKLPVRFFRGSGSVFRSSF